MSSEPFADEPPDDELLAKMAAGDAAGVHGAVPAAATAGLQVRCSPHRVAGHGRGRHPGRLHDADQGGRIDTRRAARVSCRGCAALPGITRGGAWRATAGWSRWPRQTMVSRMSRWKRRVASLEALARAEQFRDLRRALMTLPLHYREVIALCDLQELNYADAAIALECAVGTVRSEAAPRACIARGKAACRQPPACQERGASHECPE